MSSMASSWDRHDDASLLNAAAGDPGAFAEFYRRHERPVAAFFMRRTRDPEVAADLTSETFAAALVSLGRRRGTGEPAAWLFGIARNLWLRSLRTRQVEDRARRRIGVHVTLTDEIIESFEQLASDAAVEVLLEALPAEQADAVRARVLEDVSYEDLAVKLRCSPSVARQRVSRGLRALRTLRKEQS